MGCKRQLPKVDFFASIDSCENNRAWYTHSSLIGTVLSAPETQQVALFAVVA